MLSNCTHYIFTLPANNNSNVKAKKILIQLENKIKRFVQFKLNLKAYPTRTWAAV